MGKDNQNIVIKDRIFLSLIPLIIAIISFIIINSLIIHNKIEININDEMEDLKVMVSVWITILGFLVTSVSILITISGGNFINIMRGSGHFKTIIYVFLLCCIHSFIALIFSLICVFCKFWNMTIFSVFCAMVIDTMILVLIAVVFMFFVVMRFND